MAAGSSIMKRGIPSISARSGRTATKLRLRIEAAFTIRLSEFSDYAKYSKSHGNNPPYPSFKICLFHESRTTGRRIAENLKKGMWKTKSRNAGRPGSGLPQYGEITCWYKEDDLCDSIEEFCRHDLKRLKLVLDFAPVAVK